MAKKAQNRNLKLRCDWTIRNFSAFQALIEYDCAAPGIAGGGEEKAEPNIQEISRRWMPAKVITPREIAAGKKKIFRPLEAEFDKALEAPRRRN